MKFANSVQLPKCPLLCVLSLSIFFKYQNKIIPFLFFCSLKEWNDELAYLAELNVRSCIYSHDECRATSIHNDIVCILIEEILKTFNRLFLAKYRNAGQNIARRGISASYYEPTMHAATTIIMDWFLQYRNADMSYIESFHKHPGG